MIWFYQALGSIREFMELGGDVLWAIMFVLFLMWTFILERVWYIYRVYPARKRVVVEKWETRPDTSSWYARKIRDGLISEAAIALNRNIGLI
jgi:biopolymer transport protein ExbB